MKKILLLITIAFIANFANAQYKYGANSMPISDNGNVVFTQVVVAEGMTSKQLYANAKMAIAELFKSSNDVIQLDDHENGVLIIKGIDNTSTTYVSSNVSFTLKLFFKDDRYKMDMSNMKTKVIAAGQTSTYTAEEMTDANCLKNGECKKTGWGMQRKNVIDTKDKVFAAVIKAMAKSTDTNNDW